MQDVKVRLDAVTTVSCHVKAEMYQLHLSDSYAIFTLSSPRTLEALGDQNVHIRTFVYTTDPTRVQADEGKQMKLVHSVYISGSGMRTLLEEVVKEVRAR